jgi:hypothetical protein
MNELFGIRHQLDVGVGDPIEDDVVRLTFTREFGGLARGTTLDFRAAGRGSLILCSYPLEYMAALTPRVNPDATVALYGALATHAGVRRPIVVDDPRVACDVLVHDDGTRFAVLASHADENLTLKPTLPGTDRLADLDGELTMDTVILGPFEIKILKILGG